MELTFFQRLLLCLTVSVCFCLIVFACLYLFVPDCDCPSLSVRIRLYIFLISLFLSLLVSDCLSLSMNESLSVCVCLNRCPSVSPSVRTYPSYYLPLSPLRSTKTRKHSLSSEKFIEAGVTIRFVTLLFECSLFERLEAEGADEVFRVKLLPHGSDASTWERRKLRSDGGEGTRRANRDTWGEQGQVGRTGTGGASRKECGAEVGIEFYSMRKFFPHGVSENGARQETHVLEWRF